MTDLELGLPRVQFRTLVRWGGSVVLPASRHTAAAGQWATVIELGSEQEPTGQVATVEILAARRIGDGALLEMTFSAVQWAHQLDVELPAGSPPIAREVG